MMPERLQEIRAMDQSYQRSQLAKALQELLALLPASTATPEGSAERRVRVVCRECTGTPQLKPGGYCPPCDSRGFKYETLHPSDPLFAAPVAGEAERTGWLIECTHRNQQKLPQCEWVGVDAGGHAFWTTDASRALRFSREQDARAVAAVYGNGPLWQSELYVAEHRWCSGPDLSQPWAPPTPPVAGEGERFQIGDAIYFRKEGVWRYKREDSLYDMPPALDTEALNFIETLFNELQWTRRHLRPKAAPDAEARDQLRQRADATGRNNEGLSIICKDCGCLVEGVPAGDRVTWVRCRECQPKAAAPSSADASAEAVRAGWRNEIEAIHGAYPKSWEPWSHEDERFLALALAGEIGELANLVKKEWRDGTRRQEQVAEELADIMVYLHLFAVARGVDLNEQVICKLPEIRRRCTGLRLPCLWRADTMSEVATLGEVCDTCCGPLTRRFLNVAAPRDARRWCSVECRDNPDSVRAWAGSRVVVGEGREIAGRVWRLGQRVRVSIPMSKTQDHPGVVVGIKFWPHSPNCLTIRYGSSHSTHRIHVQFLKPEETP